MIEIISCVDFGIEDLMEKVFAIKGQIDSLAKESGGTFEICEDDLELICVCIETLREIIKTVETQNARYQKANESHMRLRRK